MALINGMGGDQIPVDVASTEELVAVREDLGDRLFINPQPMDRSLRNWLETELDIIDEELDRRKEGKVA